MTMKACDRNSPSSTWKILHSEKGPGWSELATNEPLNAIRVLDRVPNAATARITKPYVSTKLRCTEK